MLCRFCFSHRNFGCFDLVCLIVSSTCVIFPIGITVICNTFFSLKLYIDAATPGQNPGVARIYIYISHIFPYIAIKTSRGLSNVFLALITGQRGTSFKVPATIIAVRVRLVFRRKWRFSRHQQGKS